MEKILNQMTILKSLNQMTILKSFIVGDGTHYTKKYYEAATKITRFMEVISLMESWDDICPENNISHEIAQNILTKFVSRIRFLYKEHDFEELSEKIFKCIKQSYVSLEELFLDIEKSEGNETRKRYEFVFYDTIISIESQIDLWIADYKLTVIYNQFDLKMKYKDSDFFSLRRSFSELKPDYVITELKEKTFKYSRVHSYVKNFERSIAFAELLFPKSVREKREIPKKVNLKYKYKTTNTRNIVNICCSKEYITIENTNYFPGDKLHIDSQMREYILSKEKDVWYFIKYKDNGDVIVKEKVKSGTFLMAVTNGAARNGLFHKMKTVPFKIALEKLESLDLYELKEMYDIENYEEIMGIDENNIVIKIPNKYSPLIKHRDVTFNGESYETNYVYYNTFVYTQSSLSVGYHSQQTFLYAFDKSDWLSDDDKICFFNGSFYIKGI